MSNKVYEAIEAIQAAIGNIPKSGELKVNGQVRYTFVRSEDILAKVVELLKEHRVIVRPEIIEFYETSRDIGGGKILPTVYVKLRQTYISVADGSEFEVIVAGEGGGADDKGMRKAVTQAQKIANLLTFSIATGEDPDAVEPKINEPARPAAAAAKPAGPVENVNTLKADISRLLGTTNKAEITEKGEKFFDGKPGWAESAEALRKWRDSLKPEQEKAGE